MTPVTTRQQTIRGRQVVRGRWITAFSTTLRAQGAEFVMEPGRGWTAHGLFDWSTGGMLGGLRPKQRAATGSRTERLAQVQRDALSGRQVITEELFGGVLERERRRADRFDEVFAVLLIELKPAVAGRPAVVNAIVDALGGTMRESDVLGWVERRVVLGVILAPVQSLSKEATRDVEARVRREFASRLDAETLADISVRLFVHARPVPSAEGVSDEHTMPAELRFERPRPVCDAFKRVLDITASAILLALLLPLLLVIAALVKLTSPGPVLFRQRRIGQSARPFTMLKFRTMKANAEHSVHQKFVTDFIRSGSQPQQPGDSTVFKITDDPRVTRVGRFLRKTSLDEFPQFWNVLTGDMSLVGPRPPLQYEVEQYRSWHWRRVLEAKPGVTGLWQVAGRSRTTFDEMVRLDLRYVRSRSLWTDLKILLATPRAVVSGRGAC
jgi:lipopolysaccharide/colanic/teichoic acid biosynthesis glycosyltransferase